MLHGLSYFIIFEVVKLKTQPTMQLCKNTKKIEQIDKLSQTNEDISLHINAIIKKFSLYTVISSLLPIKRSGTPLHVIFLALVTMPFYSVKTIWQYTNHPFMQAEGGKDAYYQLKNNFRINWRKLIRAIVLQFIRLMEKGGQTADNQPTALIIDDTTIAKRGKNIEGVGFVYDHILKKHVLGFKLLVAGFWDGASFIPLDFSLHREKGKDEAEKIQRKIVRQKKKIEQLYTKKSHIKLKISKLQKEIKHLKRQIKQRPTPTRKRILQSKENTIKKNLHKINEMEKDLATTENKLLEYKRSLPKKKKKYGLTTQERRNQFKKNRPESNGKRRKKELDMSKIDSAIGMIERAVKKGFRFDYVLTDSWFFSEKLLEYVYSNTSADLISMAKINNAKFYVKESGKLMSLKMMITRFDRTHGKRNATYKTRYIKLRGTYQGIPVQIFLVRIGRHSKWNALITTDMKISFNKLMEVYKIRWSIEVFFKEAKQNLLLGQSQSRDFDGQIADVSLSFIRYILLSYYERIYYGYKVNGVFAELSQYSVTENVVADLSQVFLEWLKILADYIGVGLIEFFGKVVRDLNPLISNRGLMLLSTVEINIVEN
jgi:hypothetical protein